MSACLPSARHWRNLDGTVRFGFQPGWGTCKVQWRALAVLDWAHGALSFEEIYDLHNSRGRPAGASRPRATPAKDNVGIIPKRYVAPCATGPDRHRRPFRTSPRRTSSLAAFPALILEKWLRCAPEIF
ncbi:hypothetical protein MPL1032_220079 [Mesorhizobium plurifarium]|uniref:Uncharacterized protein n=1 Tax=Mesorhizobium plurifarium TaxID=69974 RepID=A0A0K2VYZ6_MESPL|nr:hypothetical protein MPL1032_220079 [Mesorhizobium plurifarium]